MTIRFQLQTGDLIFNKHVISGAENKQSSGRNMKNKGQRITFFSLFNSFESISNKPFCNFPKMKKMTTPLLKKRVLESFGMSVDQP